MRLRLNNKQSDLTVFALRSVAVASIIAAVIGAVVERDLDAVTVGYLMLIGVVGVGLGLYLLRSRKKRKSGNRKRKNHDQRKCCSPTGLGVCPRARPTGYRRLTRATRSKEVEGSQNCERKPGACTGFFSIRSLVDIGSRVFSPSCIRSRRPNR